MLKHLPVRAISIENNSQIFCGGDKPPGVANRGITRCDYARPVYQQTVSNTN
jgi:hypothetical protein